MDIFKIWVQNMKQKLLPFSALLIISLLVGTASAYIDDVIDITSITEEEITEENITEENITEENITEEEITEEEITEEEITEEEITEEEITEEEITEEEITEEEITEEEITEEEITEEEITEEEITEEEITEEEITEEEITEEEITEEEITEEEITEEEVTDGIVEISYNESGPFKMGDVVNITVTFNKPVLLATLTVDDDVSSPIDMINLNDTVWYCEYVVPEDVNSPVDAVVSAVDEKENSVNENDTEAFVIDNTIPEFTGIEPESECVGTGCVFFNFSAYDELDDTIIYTLCINDTENNKGILVTDECKEVEVDLDDGHYTWEVKLEDDAGNIGSSGINNLYVDTEAPKVALLSPEDCFVDTGDLLNFSFISKDDFTAQYEDLDLYYELYIDEELVDETGSGNILSGEYVEIPCENLSEGAHTWYVYVEDKAGNNITSEDRNFYVNKEGLRVLLISPENGCSPANKTFKFRVSGGSGLPFDYKLLINGEEVKSNICEEDNSLSEEEEEEEEDNSISEEEEDNSISEEDDTIFEEGENTLFVGEDPVNYYSVNAEIADGEDMTWTVLITDCADNTYEPDPYYFSLDTMAPTRVANLTAIDVEGQKEWPGTDNYPRLYFSWDKNTEDDLASMPYEVFISDLAPSAIEDMEKAGSTSDTSFYIDEYGGEPLVYEKDYWVAVIARDNAENYNDCFVAICGPVKVYEEMDSESSIYSTSTEGSGFLTGNKNSGNLEDSALNTDSGFLIETKNSEKFGGKARSGIIINLIPQLNKTTLKHTKGDYLDKQAAGSSKNSPETKSAPGFQVISAAVGIFLLAFGSNLRSKLERKP